MSVPVEAHVLLYLYHCNYKTFLELDDPLMGRYEMIFAKLKPQSTLHNVLCDLREAELDWFTDLYC